MSVITVPRTVIAVGDRVGDKAVFAIVITIERFVFLGKTLSMDMRYLNVAKAIVGMNRERMSTVIVSRPMLTLLRFLASTRISRTETGQNEREREGSELNSFIARPKTLTPFFAGYSSYTLRLPFNIRQLQNLKSERTTRRGRKYI